MKRIFIIAALAALCASCEDLTLERMPGAHPDPEDFNAEATVSLRAENTPDNLWEETLTYGFGSASRNVYIQASKAVEEGFTVDLNSAGSSFAEEYSAAKGKEYKLLPAAFYRFSLGNYIEMWEDALVSEENLLTIYARNQMGNIIEPGNYVLPLVGTSLTQDLKDTLLVVDLTIREPYTDPDGFELYEGEDMITVFYINTSVFDPRLANDMILMTDAGDPSAPQYGIGNIVNLRGASVSYDEGTGAVSVKPSSDLRYLLEHYTERILPVQESGRKVCICIDGGGQGIGYCNFTDKQIEDFTASVKRLVESYGLDGINLWDRNSSYETAAEKGHPEMNTTSYPKLIKSLREALGTDKLITLTDHEEPTEYFWDTEATGGIAVGELIDYAWSGYCSTNDRVQIIDPWHPNAPGVSTLHPRQPIAGLSQSRYGCLNVTMYNRYGDQDGEAILNWVRGGYKPNSISVYYDIRSIIQDQYEGSYISDILVYLYDNILYGIEVGRLSNFDSYTFYNKWVKDW